MWPLRRPVGERGRSRLTRDPARRSPRLLRRRVSGARSAEKESGRRSTAVRQTPLTAMLAPSVMSCITVEHRTLRRAPAERVWTDSTVPNSSTIPVNIEVPFYGELIGGNGVDGDFVNADRVGPPAPADSAGERQRFQAAQDLRAVVEEDPVDAGAFECRPVHLAAGFDHQRQALLAAEPFDDASQIGAATGPIEYQHANSARLEKLATLGR